MRVERFPVMQVIASQEQVRHLTMIVRPPDHGDVWLEVNAVPVFDDAGQLAQVVVTFFDVTDRMQAQRKLAEAEEESRLAFDGSRVATCLVSNEGRLTRVNPAMCDLLGRTEAELLTMGFLEVTHPDDAGLSADLVRDLIEGRRSSLRVTKRYVTGNGRVIWGDVTVSAVRNDGRHPSGTASRRSSTSPRSTPSRTR